MSGGGLARSPWTRLMVGVAVLVAVQAPMLRTLAQEWGSAPSLSHGFMVPLISAYLVWARRRDLAGLAFAPSLAGLPLLAGGLALYLIGTLADEPFVSRTGFLVSLPGAILFLAGRTILRALLPATAYLALMIPLPYVALKGIMDHLRVVEASLSAWLLPLLGVPVLQEGFLLHLADMTLEVAEVCSSVPAIMSLLALGLAFGYVTRRPPSVRVALVLVAVPLGFFSNIVRITLTAAGVHYIGPIALQNVLHTWHGTVVFMMTVLALSLIDSGLMRYRVYQTR